MLQWRLVDWCASPRNFMLPSQSQRVWMLLAVLVGVPGWWWLAGRLEPADGMGGWMLSDLLRGGLAGGADVGGVGGNGGSTVDSAGGIGAAVGGGVGKVWWASLAVAVLGLPAVAGAGWVAARGSALTGAWCLVGCGLVAFAGLGSRFGGSAGGGGLGGGGLGGVMRRADEAGRLELLYPAMAVEVVAWFVLLSVGLGVVDLLGRAIKPRLPERRRSRHLGGRLRLWGVSRASLGAAAVVAVLGGGLASLTVVNTAPGQVVGGLVLSFGIAGLLAQVLVPNERPWAMLMAPGLMGAAGYGWAAWRYTGTGGGDAMLEALYTATLPGLAAGLPVHYATAGVLGCLTGIGLGQVLEKARGR